MRPTSNVLYWLLLLLLAGFNCCTSHCFLLLLGCWLCRTACA
jgi:hypothetical protein